MPVTAKLSARELVQRGGRNLSIRLRELNEFNFARSDAKAEQRLAVLEARLDARIDRSEAALNARIDRSEALLSVRIDRLATALEGKLDSQVAAHAFARIDARFDQMDAKPVAGSDGHAGL